MGEKRLTAEDMRAEGVNEQLMAHACLNGKDRLEYSNKHCPGLSTSSKRNTRVDLYQQHEVESELLDHGRSIILAVWSYGSTVLWARYMKILSDQGKAMHCKVA